MWVFIFSKFLGFGIILLNTITLFVVVAMYFKKKNWSQKVLAFFQTKSRWAIMIVSVCAMAGSLIYSGLAYYEPCVLCWWQRILHYPVAMLSVGGIFWKKLLTFDSAMFLSGIGIFISLYHYLLQKTEFIETACSALGQSVSCGEAYISVFGYITIPFMSLSVFAFVFIFSVLGKKWEKMGRTFEI